METHTVCHTSAQATHLDVLVLGQGLHGPLQQLARALWIRGPTCVGLPCKLTARKEREGKSSIYIFLASEGATWAWAAA